MGPSWSEYQRQAYRTRTPGVWLPPNASARPQLRRPIRDQGPPGHARVIVERGVGVRRAEPPALVQLLVESGAELG